MRLAIQADTASIRIWGENAMSRLQWDFFEYLPVVLQDAATRDVLMVQYMTEDGLRRSLQERSMWLWSRSREEFWMAGRQNRGYDLQALRASSRSRRPLREHRRAEAHDRDRARDRAGPGGGPGRGACAG
jgi:hypothetical protein